MTPSSSDIPPLGLFIQPACLQHRYIRHANSSHIFERPERLRAVLLGVAAAVARLEEAESLLTITQTQTASNETKGNLQAGSQANAPIPPSTSTSDDLSGLLSGLSISRDFILPSAHLDIVPAAPAPSSPGQILLHHPALQLAHSTPPSESMYRAALTASSPYLKNLYKWASEAVNTIKETGCEIPSGLGLNQGDLYLGPGSILAIEGAVQTVCQAVDKICAILEAITEPPIKAPSTPPSKPPSTPPLPPPTSSFTKAFCAIRPPGHHCGEDSPSGFCYVNNVVVGALHAYLEHDIDRAIIIDFDLHHGNGTQALVMPLNAASHAEDIAIKGGKPNPTVLGRRAKPRRGWKGFYGSVHDIYSYPCEDGDLDLIKDASLSLAAHGQYIENIHLQPYTTEADFYERIYPKYLALLDKAKTFMQETGADSERTLILISAGFDACEHEHQLMQRHDRRVPTSFFSRYTRDIVKFANQYTQGKIVSVLEGGYSDRALTSAAMGHIIGMLDRSGEASWWSETELVNIERATKKKRTGPLAPFPKEVSHIPYLHRTHALLGHFEGTSAENLSATSTPQQSRMALRERKAAYGEIQETTPPAPARRARGRGVSTPAGAPRAKASETATTPSGRKSRAVTPARSSIPVNHDPMPEIKREPRDTAPPLPTSLTAKLEASSLPKQSAKHTRLIGFCLKSFRINRHL
ncbi:histone deacetylase domain-domain-containing protein [Kockovaella imperatae]|uniref:Histone deacetylase domain-domain-containing protein n=1 Tax=Kockovaella imperatae TaxID=4999 RepID=A0A1Y1USR8_9TREE|nr:histone deacetylase domain-domain-containing protein [Kockovaella imperatae]ORX41060.1 histone deacetylase domain-domain-containing protein [Kockovaella imperatae]